MEWDAVIEAEDGDWFQPTANPFGHGCCDCGLAHKVAFTLVDEEDRIVPIPKGLSLALCFTRDEEATEKLRAQKSQEE